MNKKVFLPIVVLGIACVGAVVILVTTSPVASRPVERFVRSVRVVDVATRAVSLDVRSQGTVAPRIETALVPEVNGRVVWTSPKLVSGGFFEYGEPLLQLDRADYEAAVKRARAALARAEGESDHAKRALTRQQNLSARSVVADATLNDAERNARVTAAGVIDAEVALDQAERDLARTEITAPFQGRVREERVDVGQYLTRGQSFATVYATDFVEVRLPIADSQLAYLDLPLWGQPNGEVELPEVTLEAMFAGRAHQWAGRVMRTEGEIDQKSRLVHVVARIESAGEDEPLPVGLFVKATIHGKTAERVAVVPRQALQGDGRVFVVDADGRLRFRDVEVLRIDRDEALISAGLEDGERVCISPIRAATDGMEVDPVVGSTDTDAAGPESARTAGRRYLG